MDRELIDKSFEVACLLSDIDTARLQRDKLQLVKNFFKYKSSYIDIEAQYDTFYEEMSVEHFGGEIYTTPDVWNHDVYFRIYPREYMDKGVRKRIVLELDIDEDRTLTDTEEIIKFFKDKKIDKMLENIEC